MRLTTRSTRRVPCLATARRERRRCSTAGCNSIERTSEATLQPRRAGDRCCRPAAFTDPVGARLGAGEHLRRRLDLRRPRLRRRRARRLRHPRDRAEQLLRRSAARTAGRAPSTTSAATAARGSRGGRRARSGKRHPAAPTTPGPTTSRATSAPPPTWTGSRTSTRAASACVEVRSAVVGGLVLVDLGGEAGPAEDHLGELLPNLDHYSVGDARARGGLLTYDVAGQLEGDRRELQRVPALPRRPPGAERAQRLHERRERLRRRRLVRRLDDPRRRAPRRWAPASGHAGHRPPIATPRARPTCATSTTSRCSRTRWSRSIPTT